MRIVMDDAGDVPQALIDEYNICVLPVNIMFGMEEFLSGVTMGHDAFYAKTKHVDAHNFPKTSQPTPYQFVERYKEILAEGETEILAITVSEKLSGTYASGVQAGKELEGQGTFHLFDSMGGSAAQGYMVIEAARMAQAGANIDDIMTQLHKMRDEMAVVFTIDSLEYAVKGGRVSSMQSMMASLLNIKPILRLEDGLIEQAGRVRTRKKAMTHIIDLVHQQVGNTPIRVAVMHAGVPDEGRKLQAMVASRLNPIENILVDMAIPVAINLGPGALGIAALPE